MFHPPTFYFTDTGELRKIEAPVTDGWWATFRPDEGFDIMQYTGLEDKNGVEIYEGDIVIAQYTASPQIITNKVYWEELLWTWEEIEIIGNIYENPELIK